MGYDSQDFADPALHGRKGIVSMWVRIEPQDVLLFRESKPFWAGENFRAAGRFPPTPLPMAGAIRSRALAHRGVDLSAYADAARRKVDCDAFQWAGKPDCLAPLAFTGPFLVSPEGEVWLPWPKDLLRNLDEQGKPTGYDHFLKPALKPPWSVRSSFTEDATIRNLTGGNAVGMEAPEGGFMKVAGPDDFLTYLLGMAEDGDPFMNYAAQTDAAQPEARVGLTLRAGRTAEPGRIYTAVFSRMDENASFYICVRDTVDKNREEDFLPHKGFLALGGEARAASFHVIADEADEDLPEFLKKETQDSLKKTLAEKLASRSRFKLYLLAPAIFQQGWLPDGIESDKKKFVLRLDGIKAELVAAAVGKPDDIGGWNLVANAPRPLYRAVPAGSVYFFEAKEKFTSETATALIENIHFQSLMKPQSGDDNFPKFCRDAGFGLAAIGLWDHEQEE